MAVIDVWYQADALVTSQGYAPAWAGAESADSLDLFPHGDESPPFSGGIFDETLPQWGTFANNTPIDVEHYAITVHRRYVSFLEDYYFRVHVLPGVLSLGNLLSSQIREVEVWNANFTPQLLSSIDSAGVDGIDLTEPVPAPTTFAELESRTYTVSISTVGAATIDGSFTFNFPSESPDLVITGQRVVVWPFIPQTVFTEQLDWYTDVIRAYSAEQRLALRAAGRQSINYTYQLDEYQLSRAKAISTQWSHRTYGVPVWAEATHLGALSSGVTSLSFSTLNADYRSNDIVLVWESDLKFSACETLAVTGSSVALKLPLDQSFTDAYVMPLRFARTLRGSEFTRDAHSVSMARLQFLVDNNVDLAGTSPFPQYKSRDVVTDRSVLVESMRERIVRTQEVFDNGSGPVEVDQEFGYADRTEMLCMDALDRAGAWRMRQWLHARRGKQRTFWLPSWNPDLVILNPVASAATSLTVKPIGYGLYYGVTDIMLVLKNGNRYFNRVLSGDADVGGNDVLSMETSFGVDFVPTDVDFCCFMKHCRLDTDSITLNHGYAGRVYASMPVVEVPEGT